MTREEVVMTVSKDLVAQCIQMKMVQPLLKPDRQIAVAEPVGALLRAMVVQVAAAYDAIPPAVVAPR